MTDWTQILKPLISPPCYHRPFVCEGFPDASEVIVIGNNPATPLGVDWWCFWDSDTGFDYVRFLKCYLAKRDGKESKTREFLDRFRYNGFKSIDTNALGNEGSGKLKSTPICNRNVLQALICNMACLKGIFAHGGEAKKVLKTLKVPSHVIIYETYHLSYTGKKSRNHDAIKAEIDGFCAKLKSSECHRASHTDY